MERTGEAGDNSDIKQLFFVRSKLVKYDLHGSVSSLSFQPACYTAPVRAEESDTCAGNNAMAKGSSEA